jgi:hypothetical protein
VLGVDIEINEISRYLARKSLLRGESVYISTSDGKVIANSNASVILPDSAAGDDALRFRAISELLGIEGTAGKRLSELTERATRKKFIRRGSILHPGVKSKLWRSQRAAETAPAFRRATFARPRIDGIIPETLQMRAMS